MANPIAAIALSPLLLAQGLWVRRTMPRLPEPPGPREGRAGAGPPLRLLIAGDSAAAGVGAAAQSEALSGWLIDQLAPHFRVSWRLIAETGATTAKTLSRLRATEPEPFDAVVTSLGVNDVVTGSSVRAWTRHQAELVTLLRERFRVRFVCLSGLPPVAHFPALPQPLRWFLGARSRHFDAALAAWARDRADCRHASLDFSPEPGMMAADGFHPGSAVYALWGRGVAEMIRARFSAPETRAREMKTR